MACETCARSKTRCDDINEHGCRRCRVLGKGDCTARRRTPSSDVDAPVSQQLKRLYSRLDDVQRQVEAAHDVAQRAAASIDALQPLRKRKRSPAATRPRSTDRIDFHWSASPYEILASQVSEPLPSRNDLQDRAHGLLVDPVGDVVSDLEMLTCESIFKQHVARTLPLSRCLSSLDALPSHPFHRLAVLAYVAGLSLDVHPLSPLQQLRITSLVDLHVAAIIRHDVRGVDVAQAYLVLALAPGTSSSAVGWLNLAQAMMSRSNAAYRLLRLTTQSWNEAWTSDDVEMARVYLAIRHQRAFLGLLTSTATTPHDDAVALHLAQCLPTRSPFDEHLLHELELLAIVTRCLTAFDALNAIDCPTEDDVHRMATTALACADQLHTLTTPPLLPSSPYLLSLRLSLRLAVIYRCSLLLQSLPTPLPPDVRANAAMKTYLPLFVACGDLIRCQPPDPLSAIPRIALALAYHSQLRTHHYVSSMGYAQVPDHVMGRVELEQTIMRLERVDAELAGDLRTSIEHTPFVQSTEHADELPLSHAEDPLWLALFGLAEVGAMDGLQ